MIRSSAAVLLVVAMALPGAALAHEGHEHKFLGTVVSASADRLTLKDREGEEVTVKITGDTKVRPAAKIEDLEPGTRIVVTAAMEKDKSWTAKTVDVGVRPAK